MLEIPRKTLSRFFFFPSKPLFPLEFPSKETIICSTEQQSYWSLVFYGHFLSSHATSLPLARKGQHGTLWFVPTYARTDSAAAAADGEKRYQTSPVHLPLSEVRLRYLSRIQTPVITQLIKHNYFENSISFANRFTTAKVAVGRRGADQRGELHVLRKLDVKCHRERSKPSAFRGGYNIPLEFYFRNEGKLTVNWESQEEKLKILSSTRLKCSSTHQLGKRYPPHTRNKKHGTAFLQRSNCVTIIAINKHRYR